MKEWSGACYFCQIGVRGAANLLVCLPLTIRCLIHLDFAPSLLPICEAFWILFLLPQTFMLLQFSHLFPFMPILKIQGSTAMLLFGTQKTAREGNGPSPNLFITTALLSSAVICGLVAWMAASQPAPLLWSLSAAAGCLLTATYCVKTLSLPVSPVTEVYFYLSDIWKVIATTSMHCLV